MVGEGMLEKQGSSDKYFQVAPGIWGMKIVFVNIYMIAMPEIGGWVLVDAGLKGSAGRIKAMAEDIFGIGAKPNAIVLTHGHFDHIGAIEDLLTDWDVTIYAHTLEAPYLNGKSSYPPPDPTVGGGLMSYMSWMYPKSPISLGSRLHIRTEEQGIPAMPGWRIVHTPGHSPGHIALFRESDRMLICGDAFVTTDQASAYSALTQAKELCGPPPYFTTDWFAARNSVRRLSELQPEIAAAGHGKPMYGEELRYELRRLATYFEDMAVPDHGRYVNEPARADEDGVFYVPPRVGMAKLIASAIGIAALTAGIIYGLTQLFKRKNPVKNLLRDQNIIKKAVKKVAGKKKIAKTAAKGTRAVKEVIAKTGPAAVKAVSAKRGSVVGKVVKKRGVKGSR